MSHHGNNPEKIANLVKLNTYHVSLFSKFVKKLKDTPDGDGSLLDHSLILYGSGMSESDNALAPRHARRHGGWRRRTGARATGTSGHRRKRRWRTSCSTAPTSSACEIDKFGTLSTGTVRHLDALTARGAQHGA